MAQSNTRMSPRQRMINLMYIVLTAMLALNVSSDVLDGFTQVHDGLARTNAHVWHRNSAIYSQLLTLRADNPERMAFWIARADSVKMATQELYALVDSFKTEIVRQADGVKGNVDDIVNRDDLEAASVVMLNPSTHRGEDLRHALDAYRELVSRYVLEPERRSSVEAALSTEPFALKGEVGTRQWEESKFDNQPVVAAITLLTKLQNDLRYAEGEAYLNLLAASQGKAITELAPGEMRANEINAFVVPQSRMVVRGGKYTADIMLAAVDTSAMPSVYVGGRILPKGHFESLTNKSGKFNYQGYIEVPLPDGSVQKYPFQSEYTVIDPYATVSATMMNVLYAGIDNPISISIPGVSQADVSATMTNGTLSRSGDGWIARPSKIGEEAVVTVSASLEGRQQVVNTTSFKVRKLPDPTPYIALGHDRYKGSKPVSKSALQGAGALRAAIDDGLLDIEFQVLGFEMTIFDSMGNAIPEVSAGSTFSERQKASLRQLGRGKRFFITRIRAKGPDGIERTLSPMEIIIN